MNIFSLPPFKIFFLLFFSILFANLINAHRFFFLLLIPVLYLFIKKRNYLYYLLFFLSFGFYTFLLSPKKITINEGIFKGKIIWEKRDNYLLNLKEYYNNNNFYYINLNAFLKTTENFKIGEELIFYGELRKKDFYSVNNFFLLRKRKNKELEIIKRIRNYLEKILERYLEKGNSGIVLGIFLGEKKKIDKKIKEDFRKTGLYHLLAVSGLHISLLAFVLLLVLSLMQIPFSFRYLLLIPILFIYASLCSFSPSVLRASLMFLFITLAYFLNRKTLPLNNLFSAGILILLFSPLSLFNISFQLSFLATFGILYFSQWGENLMKIKNHFLRKYIIQPFLLSLSSWLAISPIIIYFFNNLPTATVFANIIIIPLIGIILPLILIVLFFSLFSPLFTLIFSQTLNFLLKILVILIHYFSKTFPVIRLGKEYALIFFILLILLIFLRYLFYQKNSY